MVNYQERFEKIFAIGVGEESPDTQSVLRIDKGSG